MSLDHTEKHRDAIEWNPGFISKLVPKLRDHLFGTIKFLLNYVIIFILTSVWSASKHFMRGL